MESGLFPAFDSPTAVFTVVPHAAPPRKEFLVKEKTTGKSNGTPRRARRKAGSSGGLDYTVTIRVRVQKSTGKINNVLSAIRKARATTHAIDVGRTSAQFTEQDITLHVRDDAHGREIADALKKLPGVEVRSYSTPVFLAHLGGKLIIKAKAKVETREQLGQIYTPGAADVCQAIVANPEAAWSLTMKGKMVAIISNGTRTLGLGNTGPLGFIPVGEGKAVLMCELGEFYAMTIPLDTENVDELVRTIEIISPMFGAINLEDIRSPDCYEVEDRLRKSLNIPVFHDDQHATAIAVLAGAINAAKVVGKPLESLKLVAAGTGAAGFACIKLLMDAGVKDVIAFNVDGPVYRGRTGLGKQEQWLAENSNQGMFKGTLKEALAGRDMFLGLAASNLLKGRDLKVMNKNAIVFALANPIPEVNPDDARRYVRVMATGSSKWPNQVNNAVVFPGIFRGALAARVRQITEEMKMAAAFALASVIPDDDLHEDLIIPSVLQKSVAKAISRAVVKVAVDRGLARRIPQPDEL